MTDQTTIKFGTDGWRGKIADTFTFDNIQVVSQAIANYLKSINKSSKGIIIGYDMRFLSEKFAEVVASVMTNNQIPVFITERATPTPITAYAALLYQTAGAIMITASHNPPEYNGIKFIPDYAGPATNEITKSIEAQIENVSRENLVNIKSSEKFTYVNPIDEYINYIKDIINFDTIKGSGLNIIFDPMYGAGQGILDRILKTAGCNVYGIHNYRNVIFGNSLPDPSEENLVEMKNLIEEKKADLGLALDGDADRFGVIDSKGVYLSPNKVLTILADYLLETRKIKGSIVRTVATTHLLDRIAKHNNLNLIETPVGFKYVGEIMRKEAVVIGGEESGGLSVNGHIPEKDGLLACLLLVEATAYNKKPLSETLKDIYNRYGQLLSKRLDIEYPLDKKELLTKLKDNPPADLAIEKLIDIDGVKYILKDESWMLIRPSGTEPLIRIYIEAENEEKLKKLEDIAMEIVKV
ncbi:MAG: phosphoglucomutase/phosphomannomutase family protein [Actinobacteria bacterium]|nr:phosphoglucomutase/phosphomannomutase family protein [Actinomycetota bacterium]